MGRRIPRTFTKLQNQTMYLLRGSEKLPDGGVNAVSGLQNKPV
ncbi:hypothetical protein HMPREF3212_04156 [Citrobacter freundii]|nr:hypothetical protein HMPREF3212_04156 [Citrobacter freundii]